MPQDTLMAQAPVFGLTQRRIRPACLATQSLATSLRPSLRSTHPQKSASLLTTCPPSSTKITLLLLQEALRPSPKPRRQSPSQKGITQSLSRARPIRSPSPSRLRREVTTGLGLVASRLKQKVDVLLSRLEGRTWW
jgi:hypothetical protein